MERAKTGRPRVPKEHQAVYQRIAILPKTYDNIKVITKREKIELIYWLDEVVEKILNKEEK